MLDTIELTRNATGITPFCPMLLAGGGLTSRTIGTQREFDGLLVAGIVAKPPAYTLKSGLRI